jgi:hypothetical protein
MSSGELPHFCRSLLPRCLPKGASALQAGGCSSFYLDYRDSNGAREVRSCERTALSDFERRAASMEYFPQFRDVRAANCMSRDKGEARAPFRVLFMSVASFLWRAIVRRLFISCENTFRTRCTQFVRATRCANERGTSVLTQLLTVLLTPLI